MNERIDGVPVAYGAGAWSSADEIRPVIRRMIAGLQVRSVEVNGTVRFQMESGVRIDYMDLGGGPALSSVLQEHARAIEAERLRSLRPHVIDANDAHVALASGARHLVAQLSRTACRSTRITVWKDGRTSVTPGLVELAPDDGVRVRLESGRISSYVRRDRETWSNGTLLVGGGVQMPAALVGALPGRLLDDVVSGTMLAGLGLTIRKAWNVGGALGMSFEPRMIDVHEALAAATPLRTAA